MEKSDLDPDRTDGPASKTVIKALVLLEAVSEGYGTVQAAAKASNMHRSTASRLLRTLSMHGFVRRDGDATYHLGPKLIRLGYRALDELNVRVIARPHLETLNERTGQTIHLAELVDDEVIYIDKLESRDAIRMYSRIGKVAPLHCTGVAKAILAFLPSDVLEGVLSTISWRRYTDTTITSPSTFLDELEAIRVRGFAVDDAEHEAFIRCIAAPILDANGKALAAVSISSPLLPLDKLTRWASTLLDVTVAVSTEYGG